MKKLLLILLTVCLAFSIVACGDMSGSSKTTTTTTSEINLSDITTTVIVKDELHQADPYGLGVLVGTQTEGDFRFEIYEKEVAVSAEAAEGDTSTEGDTSAEGDTTTDGGNENVPTEKVTSIVLAEYLGSDKEVTLPTALGEARP